MGTIIGTSYGFSESFHIPHRTAKVKYILQHSMMGGILGMSAPLLSLTPIGIPMFYLFSRMKNDK